ncbi:hypothetical protein ACGFZB_25745 [Streptomyces cinerochromogenes]|uniref:Uncharacterized protein n=1 Tax=Streptomyces cinerochromogenes TaxID=66422 RepID=A0ABW7BCZ4_9ACTN
MATDRTQQLVLALVVTMLGGYVGYTHPNTVPALSLGVGAFVAIAAVLKL